MKVFKVAGAEVVLMGLAACSSEPSSKDVEKALAASLEQTATQLMSLVGETAFGKDMLPTLHSAKKIKCSEVENPAGYACDVEVDMTNPVLGGRNNTVSTMRFVKGSDGWIVVGQPFVVDDLFLASCAYADGQTIGFPFSSLFLSAQAQ